MSAMIFVWTEGFYSYGSMVALEMITLSTTLAIMMLIDAMVSCHCLNRKKKHEFADKSKLKATAVYESDEEEIDDVK